MVKIRTKLLIYFATILLLIVLLFFVREQSNQKVIDLYNENVEHLFLLNEITRMTSETLQSLQIYVYEPLSENLGFYQEDKQQLLQLQQEFKAEEKKGISKKNFLNLMTSFLEQTDQTVESLTKQDIQHYSMYLQEAEITSSYIHEETLDLINKELTTYQEISNPLDQKIINMQKMGIAIIISIMILSILFALWFSNGITRTIERLTWAAQDISAGRYSGEDVVVSRKDELWFLTKTFNEMKKSILESVSEIEEKARLARLLKEMELKSLQNQINPHFLFNTLNTISKTSYIEGAEKTSDLISSVSTLLRYNIGNLERQTNLED
jgi:sensor histidine kinase YesM